MAYVKDLSVECSSPSCSRRATREVFNMVNASLGVYCAVCARRVYKWQEKRERELRRRVKAEVKAP